MVIPRLDQLSGKRLLESWFHKEMVCGKKFLEWNGLGWFAEMYVEWRVIGVEGENL